MYASINLLLSELVNIAYIYRKVMSGFFDKRTTHQPTYINLS